MADQPAAVGHRQPREAVVVSLGGERETAGWGLTDSRPAEGCTELSAQLQGVPVQKLSRAIPAKIRSYGTSMCLKNPDIALFYPSAQSFFRPS